MTATMAGNSGKDGDSDGDDAKAGDAAEDQAFV